MPHPAGDGAQPRPGFDLSDNAARAHALRQLTASAAVDLDPSLRAWAMPRDPVPPGTPALGVGNVWHNLNQLRVLNQYAHLLGDLCAASPFLAADPATCVLGLEWASGLLGPLQAPPQAGRDCAERLAAGTGLPRGEALFALHRSLPCYDRAVAQLLLETHFPSSREYEADVCRAMLRCRPDLDYSGWLHAFPKWRERGLLYPLAVAARHMPGIDHWLPPEARCNALAGHFEAFLRCVNDPAAASDPVACLRAVERAWAEDATQTRLLLGHLADRVAVLMGVKSNGGGRHGFDLAAALAGFPREWGDTPHEANHRAWHGLRREVEGAFPPSLLCAPLVRPKRATWGHPTLTLRVSYDGVARFAEAELQAVAPPADGAPHVHTPPHVRHCLSFQTSARVQDVLWRLGEIVLSPDVALCMLRPQLAAAQIHQGGSPPTDAGDLRPDALLQRMAGPLPPRVLGVPTAYLDAMRRLDATVPPVRVVRLPRPARALFWCLNIPGRAIVYVGDGADVRPSADAHHRLSKLLLNCKVPPCHVGGLLAPPADRPASEALVRAAVRAFAADGLDVHPANTALVRADANEAGAGAPRQTTPVLSTTLAESVACFGLTAPPRLSVAPLGQSCPWQENGIDPRYAERQDAENGFRYRDWVAMHAGRAGTQQSRLAAHCLDYDELHLTAMPWVADDGVRWVHVASTAPPVSRTLHGRTLRLAVEGRFLHDPRMLPLRDRAPDRERPAVSRSDAELYAAPGDPDQLAIVYAAAGSRRLEMIAFRLADAAI